MRQGKLQSDERWAAQASAATATSAVQAMGTQQRRSTMQEDAEYDRQLSAGVQWQYAFDDRPYTGPLVEVPQAQQGKQPWRVGAAADSAQQQGDRGDRDGSGRAAQGQGGLSMAERLEQEALRQQAQQRAQLEARQKLAMQARGAAMQGA